MAYAPADYWDRFFRSRREAGAALDSGGRWVAAFGPILRARGARTALDLGCGSGADVRRLAALGVGAVGLDYSLEALRYAAGAGPPGRFVLADMAAGLPFPDARFDAAMANVSIHMFGDAQTRALLRDVRRILRPGGLFLFHVNALEDRALRERRKGPSVELEPDVVREADGQTMHYFSDAYLRELLREWRGLRLEFVEIPDGAQTAKCVWRGVAEA